METLLPEDFFVHWRTTTQDNNDKIQNKMRIISTILLLLLSPVSLAKRTENHQHALLRASVKVQKTTTFGRDGTIENVLPLKLSVVTENGDITSVSFTNHGDMRTMSVSANKLVDTKDSQNKFGFKTLGPNIFLLYPDSVGVGGALTYYADREGDDLDLDGAITMVQNFVRRFEQQLFSSARNENVVLSDPALVIRAFRSSASYVQDIVQDLEDTETDREMKLKLESVKNGMCETFNRLAKLYTKVAKAFDEALARKPAPPISPKARKLLDKAAKSGAEDLTKNLMKLIETATQDNGGPTDLRVAALKENEKQIKKEFQKGIVKFVESNPDTLGEIFEFAADIETDAKKKVDEIKKWSKERADEIWTFIKGVWKNLFDSAKEAKANIDSNDKTKPPPDCTKFNSPFNKKECCAKKCRSVGDTCVYNLEEGQTDTCPPVKVSCMNPDNEWSGKLTGAEKRVLANILDAEVRKKLGISLWVVDVKPDIKIMLDKISLKIAITQIVPGQGHSDIKADIKVNEILNDKRSMDFDVTASSTRVFSEGHHLTLGGRFILNGLELNSDMNVASIDAIAFLRHQVEFNNGVKLNSGLFVDVGIKPPTDQKFVKVGVELEAQLRKLKLTGSGTGTFGMDGSKAFQLKLGMKHEFKANLLGDRTRMFLDLNGQLDTGVSILGQGPGFVPDVAAPQFGISANAMLGIRF